jgi:hypothetical protein
MSVCTTLRAMSPTGRFARREDIADLRRIDLFARVSDTGIAPRWAAFPRMRPPARWPPPPVRTASAEDCPEFSRCFLFKARQAAQQADIVVVNHHLVCADMALRDEGVSELLPTAAALIFDEAHQLPEVATTFFGEFGRPGNWWSSPATYCGPVWPMRAMRPTGRRCARRWSRRCAS